MATTTTSRATPTASRRSPPSSSPTPPPASIARGATARSAASPRVPSSLNSSVTRRPSTKASQALPNGETREALSASLKQETEQKEQLLLQVQNRDQAIASLAAENNTLTSTLNAAETRLNELYADQARAEAEMAQRIDIAEKLRAQVREFEREKRDLQRRYNEQAITFEAERQALYDNEQHLKSRISSLTQVRKQAEPEPESEAEAEEEEVSPQVVPRAPSPKLPDPATEPAEMTSLRLELSTLSTSYSSLQSTLVLLQTQLLDLKRVNHELQEENESYMILLREKTLSGQFDLMRQVGGGSSDDDDDVDVDEDEYTDVGSLRSIGKSTLDRVDEEDNERSFEQELEHSLEHRDSDSPTSHSSRPPGRHSRKRATSPGVRGESLADLPITGPGLDLAAELGRAENKDIFSGNIVDDRHASSRKHKRSKKSMDNRKVTLGESSGLEPSGSINDIDALRTEVKSLKDANKALSLYASKIIDRIISQEGFEHVLAVDYDKEPPTPSTAVPAATKPAKEKPKPRPQSVILGRSSSNPMPATDPPAFKSPPTNGVPKLDNPPNPPNLKTQRRSLSFDWKGFFVAEKKPEPILRPLTLKPGSSPVTGVAGARKLETYEDEEDRRERERLNATMKLMGIQPSVQPPIQGVLQTPSISNSSTGTPSSNRRFSLWGSRASADNSETTSVEFSPSLDAAGNSRVGLGIGSTGLTQEALEHVEAENTLAALDAHERNLSAEIARGSNSGFTEIAPRSASGRRSRRSAGGSGSGGTVWSAGMSGNGEDGEE